MEYITPYRTDELTQAAQANHLAKACSPRFQARERRTHNRTKCYWISRCIERHGHWLQFSWERQDWGGLMLIVSDHTQCLHVPAKYLSAAARAFIRCYVPVPPTV